MYYVKNTVKEELQRISFQILEVLEKNECTVAEATEILDFTQGVINTMKEKTMVNIGMIKRN